MPHRNLNFQSKTKIFLVMDHGLIREGMRAIIGRETNLILAGESEKAAEALPRLESLAPDVLIIDEPLAGGEDLEFFRRLFELRPQLRILMLAARAEADTINRAMQSGAHGYILKNTGAAELIKAIKTVTTGHTFLSPEASQALLANYKKMLAARAGTASPRLTDRELKVLKLTAEGLRVKDIATRMKTTPKSVEAHRAQLRKKLGFNGTAELTRYAIREGISPL